VIDNPDSPDLPELPEPPEDALYVSNFQNYEAGTPFTEQQAKDEFGADFAQGFGGSPGLDPNGTNQYALFENDPEGKRGTVMCIALPRDSYVKTPPGSIKVETRIDWNGKEDDIWLAYDIFFSSNYKFNPGFKLLGMLASSVDGGSNASGGKCSARCSVSGDYYPNDGTVPDFRPYKFINDREGAFNAYYYYMNNPQRVRFFNKVDPTVRITDETADQQHNIEVGKWQRIKMNFKMNTVNVEGGTYDEQERDGHARWYLDGQLMWDHSNIVWRNKAACKWDLGYFAHFYGGADENFKNPNDREQQVYYDNIVIAPTDPDA
jgi:hypothetical protein